MTEVPAKGKRGFLLYSPFTKSYFFRIYKPGDKREFTDYDLCADDIEIELVDNFTALYESEDRNRLDYTSKVMGREKK